MAPKKAAAAVAVPVGTPVAPHGVQGSFSDGLWDCWLDKCSCFTIMCCAPTAVGQLTQRILTPGRKGACLIVATLLWIGLFFDTFFQR